MTISFSLGADLTNQARSTTVTSSVGTVSGIGGGSAAIGFDSGDPSSYYRINGGGWISISDKTLRTVVDGDTVQVRLTTSVDYGITLSNTLKIGSTTDPWSATTEARDEVPNAFDFVDVSGVEPNSVNTSAIVTISGTNANASGSSTGGTFSVDGGAYSAGPKTVPKSAQLRARGTASASYSTAVDVVVTITGVSGTYRITTRAADTTPDVFAFTDQSSVPASSVITSNAITVAGIEAPAALSFSVSGGTSHEYRKNGGTWTAVGNTTIANGDTLEVRLTSPGSAGQSGNITVTIGGVSDTFSATVGVPDSTPDPFTFVDNADVAKSTVATSNIITISGIDTSSSVSFSTSGGSSHEYRKNGGAWTAVGATTVVNGDTLQVRATVPGTAGQTAAVTMTVGGVSDTYTATAQEPDTTPDAFSFPSVAAADPNSVTASAAITVQGINTTAAISVAGGEYRVNGGGWTATAGTVGPGDQVETRLTSSASLAASVTATVTIGGVAGTFTVTTRSPDSSSQYVVTFREAIYGVDF